jgi:hypothetical protein
MLQRQACLCIRCPNAGLQQEAARATAALQAEQARSRRLQDELIAAKVRTPAPVLDSLIHYLIHS